MKFLQKTKTLLLGLAVLGMVSCESGKNNDPTPVTNPTNPPADSTGSNPNANPNLGKCMFSEAKWIDLGTEYIIGFQFDEHKRVTKQLLKENGVEQAENSRFHYSSTSPFQVIKQVYYHNNTPLSFNEYEYNAQNQLIKNSLVDYNGQGGGNGTLLYYFTYEYRPDKMLGRRNRFNSLHQLIGYTLYSYPTLKTVTEQGYSITAGAASLSYKVEFSFDDKKSFINTLGVIFTDELVSYNNEIASTTTYYNPTSTTSSTTTYEYNTEGLPTKATTSTSGVTDVFNLSYNCK